LKSARVVLSSSNVYDTNWPVDIWVESDRYKWVVSVWLHIVSPPLLYGSLNLLRPLLSFTICVGLQQKVPTNKSSHFLKVQKSSYFLMVLKSSRFLKEYKSSHFIMELQSSHFIKVHKHSHLLAVLNGVNFSLPRIKVAVSLRYYFKNNL